ncbi:hypothetical protein MTP99_018496 [Tenebrio molitor]|nr:hypothetical protein MTP99_018496 [Tenebrio molitor]
MCIFFVADDAPDRRHERLAGVAGSRDYASGGIAAAQQPHTIICIRATGTTVDPAELNNYKWQKAISGRISGKIPKRSYDPGVAKLLRH